MSRASKKRRSRGSVTAQVQRAGQPNIRPGGQNFQSVNDKVIQAMYQHLGPQKNQGAMYPPGAPIKPVPGITPPGGPRQFQYPVGYNIAQLPRSTELYSFADLRSMASSYYGIQMCQQVWFDYIDSLELIIKPRSDLIEDDADLSIYQDDIRFYEEFFAYPDKDHDLHSWLQMAVRDQLELDALSIFIRKDRIGRPYALDILDSATIKPLIDDRGRRPQPPFPAFEQFIYGIPACFLTTDDLIYHKEVERSESVYGFPRTQKIILLVMMALRKESKDLTRFTDGTVPQGVIELLMDVNWSQEEIEAYEIQFNNLMAGNDEMRARIKILPRGFQYKTTNDPDIHMDLDTFLLNATAACYGLTMAELAFIQDVNRSSGETQQNVVYRRAMGPLIKRYSRLLTSILRKFFKEDRFVVAFKGYEEKEDFKALAEAYSGLTTAGIQSPTQAARAMHLPVYNDTEIPPFVMTKSGPIMIEDLANPELRQAQLQAQLAGYQLTANSQQSSGEQDDAEALGQQDTPGEEEAEEERRWDAIVAQPHVQQALRRLAGEALKEKTKEGGFFVERSTQTNTGMMLALLLDPKAAKQLALPGGEPASELHITLGYLGDTLDTPDDTQLRPHTSPLKIQKIVAEIASDHSPLCGRIAGLGRFVQPVGEPDVVIALPDIPGLPVFRQRLIEAVQEAGYFVAEDHGYTPHISLMYIDKGAPMPIENVPPLALTFNQVHLVIGDVHHSFPLGEKRDETTQSQKNTQDIQVTRQFTESDTDPSTGTARLISGSVASGHADQSRTLAAEYRRWRSRALDDVKTGRSQRRFTSDLIPPSEQETLAAALAKCTTADEVRFVFEHARKRDTSPKAPAASESGGDQGTSKSAWKLRW